MDKIGKKGRLDGEIAVRHSHHGLNGVDCRSLLLSSQGGITDKSSSSQKTDDRLSSAWKKALRLTKNDSFFKNYTQNRAKKEEKFKTSKKSAKRKTPIDFMIGETEKPFFKKTEKPFGLPTLKELDSQRAVIKESDSSDSFSSSGATTITNKSSKLNKLEKKHYLKEAKNISDILGSPNTTYTVNPVVVEIEAKPYQRTEHKIVVRNDNSDTKDLGWFKRLLPEEYFKRPTLKRNLPSEPQKNIEVKEKFIINKPQKNENFNVDELMPDKFYKKEEEVVEKREPEKIEMKMLKLPRLPYERCKKLGKFNVSMTESSDDSIRTREIISRPSSGTKRFSYDRSLFADARKMFFTEIRKERNRREEERRRNFNKLFATFNHTSKTQEELFKSKDLESFCRREGLNVLYQRHAERKFDETMLQKWQRLGRKFYPEALHEELRYRKHTNKIYEEYKPQKVQPVVVKKPEIPIPSVIPRPTCVQTELDKNLILKGVDKAIKVEHVKKEIVQHKTEDKTVENKEESKKETLDKAVQLSTANILSKKENAQPVKSCFKKAAEGNRKRVVKKAKKNRVRKAKRKKDKKAESEITTVNSDVFDKTNSSKPVQPDVWPQLNANVYLVQTEYPNVPESLIYTKRPSSDDRKSGDKIDEWSQYGRTASETDRLLSSLTQRIKEKLNSPKVQKLKHRGKVSSSDRDTLRSTSFSCFDVEKVIDSRKFSSDTSVRQNKLAKLLEKFPEEQMKPVLLPSQPQFSTSTMNLSFIQKTDSFTHASLSTSKLKCTMTSSLTDTTRIESFFKEIKETSLIDVHRTNAMLNVQKINYDPSSQSFLDITYSECGEKIQPNSCVGHRFFRTPLALSEDLIEIKKECEYCQRSQTDIVPHTAQAMINIHYRESNREAGDSVQNFQKSQKTPEDSEDDISDPVSDADSVPKDSSDQTQKVPSEVIPSEEISTLQETALNDDSRKST